ncbi:MAG TPA: DUF1674 domain-containing protein [Dokdonella sp.]
MSEANPTPSTQAPHTPSPPAEDAIEAVPAQPAKEIGGRESGLEPTRYGDWEKNGRCIDF